MMIEALKKLITFAAALAVLLLLLYIAFYLFLVGLAVIAGIMIYVKLKGIGAENTKEAPHHYWWKHQEKHSQPGRQEEKTTKTVIIESTEYKEVEIEEDKRQ